MTTPRNQTPPVSSTSGGEPRPCAEPAPQCEQVIIEVTADRRIAHVGGWDLSLLNEASDEEPRVRDLDLGERLELADPRQVRKLIRTHKSAGNVSPYEVMHAAEITGGRPAREYWLTEADALFIATQSGTKAAVRVTKEMIRVFMLARRGLLGEPPSSDVIARAVAAALAAHVAPMDPAFLARFTALEVQVKASSAPRQYTASPLPPPMQAAMIRCEVREIAAIMVKLGPHRTLKSYQTQVQQMVKGVTGFGGSGATWALAPSETFLHALGFLGTLKSTLNGFVKMPKSTQMQLDIPSDKKN